MKPGTGLAITSVCTLIGVLAIWAPHILEEIACGAAILGGFVVAFICLVLAS
jgi:hypothetical protein